MPASAGQWSRVSHSEWSQGFQTKYETHPMSSMPSNLIQFQITDSQSCWSECFQVGEKKNQHHQHLPVKTWKGLRYLHQLNHEGAFRQSWTAHPAPRSAGRRSTGAADVGPTPDPTARRRTAPRRLGSMDGFRH